MNLSQASQTDFIEKQRNGFLHIETFFHQATMAKAAMEGFLNLDFVKMVNTPARSYFISGLKSRVLKLTFFA